MREAWRNFWLAFGRAFMLTGDRISYTIVRVVFGIPLFIVCGVVATALEWYDDFGRDWPR